MCGMKLLIAFQTSAVEHTLLGILLLIHAGIKVKPWK